MMRRLNCKAAIVIAAVTGALGQAGGQPLRTNYSFSPIQVPGAADSVAYGVNDHGLVVGEFGNVSFAAPFVVGNKGFAYDGREFRTIEFPGSVFTRAIGVNNSGEIVGEYVLADGLVRAFRFDGQNYDSIQPITGSQATAFDINDNGVVVGVNSVDGFTPTAGFLQRPGQPPEVFSGGPAGDRFYQGINNNEQVAGWSSTMLLAIGFVTPGDVNLFFPGRDTTEATAINDNGIVAGRHGILDFLDLSIDYSGFLYDLAEPGSYTDVALPDAGCTQSCAASLEGLNDSQAIVGFVENASGGLQGFLGKLPDTAASGDYNGDGLRDAQDYEVWRSTFGATGLTLAADGNGDHVVDAADYTIWRDNLPAAAHGKAATAPEPSPLMMLSLLAWKCFGRTGGGVRRRLVIHR
ncbi:MAG: hypothetical protein AAGJ46_04415 [Planctomycetota bacterium]